METCGTALPRFIPVFYFSVEFSVAVDLLGGGDKHLQHFQKIDSASRTSLTKLPKMAVTWATGCDIGLKSSLPFCNHAL